MSLILLCRSGDKVYSLVGNLLLKGNLGTIDIVPVCRLQEASIKSVRYNIGRAVPSTCIFATRARRSSSFRLLKCVEILPYFKAKYTLLLTQIRRLSLESKAV